MNLLPVFCILFIFNNLYGQIDTSQEEILPVDSILVSLDSLKTVDDTLVFAADSLLLDSTLRHSSKKLSPDALKSSIKYISQDSIIINLNHKKILLFEDVKTYYDDIELDAAFVEYGFTNSELYASGIADTCGHIHGPPVFKQGSTEFCSQEMRYNFKTSKAKVTKVITEEGEGFIHGYYIKHVDEKISYVKGGQYTTCNLEHPHFQLRFGKAKLIQNDKIITGPAYISFGNIPTPVAIPFGYFPIKRDRVSGIVIPRFHQSDVRGFVFEDFGYYFGINDNFDLLLAGDITTRGSWVAKAKTNYVYKYKCSGLLEMSFSQNFTGEKNTMSWDPKEDFRFAWTHRQDVKAHPTTRFSARVDVISGTFNKYNPSTTADYLSNEFVSSLNFSTSANNILFLDAAVYYRQNTYRKDISISLPELNLSVAQFYPFRKKNKAGKLKWYDNITLRWSSEISNKIDTYDSLFFKRQTWEEMKTGIKHTIPLKVPIKLGKALNWNSDVIFTENWYLQRDRQTFYTILNEEDSLIERTKNVFQRGFYALHDLCLSTSLTTKLYGNYYRKKGVAQIRHVMTPDLSFTYRPNINGNTVYGTYFNTITGQEVEYSYFGVNSKTQAIARFTLGNNLELKVKSKKDTITGTRKVPIFDNLSISFGYDFAADSLRWQPLTISGRTSLFSFLDITFRLSFDPYIIGSDGRRINQTEAKVNKRAMRFSESGLNIGLNWRLNQDFFKGKKKDDQANEKTTQESETIFPENGLGMPNRRPDFKNPWNITINYTFAYNVFDNPMYYVNAIENNKKYKNNIVQTINISGDVNITRKWKIGFTTGYDIKQKDFSYTSIDIYRDLHCWEMRLNWIPFGYRRGWNFQINVKASVLQDLKFKMQRDFRDNYESPY